MKFAVKDCYIVKENDRFLLVDTSAGICTKPELEFSAHYDNSLNFNFQHILFVLNSRSKADSYKLECNTIICDKTDADSDCNKSAVSCMNNQSDKKSYLCDGYCDTENNLQCQIIDDLPVCVET